MRALIGVFVIALALSGCSAGRPAVSTEDLVDQVNAVLEQEVGRLPEAVVCPKPLAAEVGAKVRCALTDGGVSYGITLTVTEVVGTTVNFDVVVDDLPLDETS